ncbi:hypothetical protein D7D52_37210 [Nocardia yunnanensis]|uniref:MarR family transcriptional regulator n=1 Tax=Nocardia yunnanensis TaxID=2382165 RepID=A0A386ZMI3_9NOCA|nr:hypothetical protein [Nocardia yunnanensis]AYF78533.1 hypothetical protein D7D52_37210 [Nocardia yunnanensis]
MTTGEGRRECGLIERRAHPTDRRTHQIFVTAQGRAVYKRAHAAVGRREAELEAAYTPQQRAVVREWLSGVSAACH